MSQYDWVIDALTTNPQSRKAFINLNQPRHKKPETDDFPCVTGAQFFIREDDNGTPALCADISSRSTDLVTGLPYNVGFFTTIQELVQADLVQRGMTDLRLGYFRMRPNFAQVYDRTLERAHAMLQEDRANNEFSPFMPPITDAQATLKDIYGKTAETPMMKWLYETAGANGTRFVEDGVVYRIPKSN